MSAGGCSENVATSICLCFVSEHGESAIVWHIDDDVAVRPDTVRAAGSALEHADAVLVTFEVPAPTIREGISAGRVVVPGFSSRPLRCSPTLRMLVRCLGTRWTSGPTRTKPGRYWRAAGTCPLTSWPVRCRVIWPFRLSRSRWGRLGASFMRLMRAATIRLTRPLGGYHRGGDAFAATSGVPHSGGCRATKR